MILKEFQEPRLGAQNQDLYKQIKKDNHDMATHIKL